MNINPLSWDTAQWQAAGKQFASAAAGGVGMLVTLHFISPVNVNDIGENVNHIINGAEEIAKGVAGLLATLTLVYTSLRSASNASLEAKKAAVTQQPNTLVVTASPGTSTVVLASKVAAIPETHEVLAAPAIAAATPSDKVVSPDTEKKG